MGEVVLYVEDFETGYEVSRCRICHEEEFESYHQLEAPCACSGTIKFAHRNCIQRWCSEKGSTLCEICLQNYEPEYRAAPKKPQPVAPGVAMRDALQMPATEQDPATPTSPSADADSDYNACNNAAADRSASCWRLVAFTFTLLLLVRHFYEVLVVGTAEYPFPTATVLILRSSGIIFPMYVLIWAITAVQNSVGRHRYRDPYDDFSSLEDDGRQNHSV